MREEIARAMKRAKEAAGKEEYESPLGHGFAFASPDDRNPYSKRAPQGAYASSPSFEIDYEESHFGDFRSGTMRNAKKVVHERERVRHNLHARRKERLDRTSMNNGESSNGCSVM